MLPVSFLKIVNCHMAPVWSPKTGTNIGGVAPVKFGMVQGAVLGLPNAAVLSATNASSNPGYADWLSGGVFRLPESCTGHLQMGIAFFVDKNSLTDAQAIEMDTKITDANRITYDGSLQFEYSQSATLMHVQIDKPGGGWKETGIILPKFTAGVEHTVLVEYSFNTTTKTSEVVSITIDGVFHSLNLWSIAGSTNEPNPWAPNEILPQLQQDLKPIANATWEWIIIDMFYNVW